MGRVEMLPTSTCSLQKDMENLLISKSRISYALRSQVDIELRITYSTHKILGVILLRVNIAAIATVNSES